MKKIIIALALLSQGFVFSQTFIQAYADRANLVSQTNINSLLTQYQGFGVKTTGTAANVNAFNWLKSTYQNIGYTTAQIAEDPFTFNTSSSKNLVVTKTGTLHPNTYVIICGHFDTVSGPGTNDNGSGTSIILEAARILKDVPTEYSIKFIHFSGEEQGLRGSQHYVNNVVNSTNPKMDIRLVINLDQVGGRAGMTNNTVYCERDQDGQNGNDAVSASMTSQLANCTSLYSPLQTVISAAYNSDYIPFENNGEVITGYYEHNVSPHPHTATDIYANMDPVFVYNLAKAATGALQHFAVASSAVMSATDINSDSLNTIQIFPNPARDFIEIQAPNSFKNFSFSLVNAEGRTVLETKNVTKINVSKFPEGLYIAKIAAGEKSVTKKIVINR